ncbi:hypothetical protein [Kineococcus sp. SYSU DK005]|uniref:hypothetical protein n=1 Tax=Kineococcus sp. SYSU DK005 TaxID=3383126 RepID=UPI003D7C42AE
MLPRTAAGRRAAPEPSAVVHAVWVRPGRLLWWVERGGPPVPHAVHVPAGATHPAHPGALRGQQRAALLRSGMAGAALHAVLAGPTRWVPALLPARDGVPLPSPDAFARLPWPRRHPAPVELAVTELPCTAPPLGVSVEVVRGAAPGGWGDGGRVVPGREVVHLGALVRDLAAFAAAAPASSSGPGAPWRRRRAATLPAALRAGVPGARGGALSAAQVVDDVVGAVLPHLRRDALPVPAAATGRVVLLLGGPVDAVGAAGSAGADAPSEPWWVDVTLSVGGAAPLRIGELTGDPIALEALRDGLARAVAVCPVLRSAQRDAADAGRLRLPTAVAAELVDRGADLLHGAGVAVLVPREVAAALRRRRQLQSKRWIRQDVHPSQRRRWGGSA